MTDISDRLVVDLLDPELYQRNPHDVWTWMRANEPVYRDRRNGLGAVTRHADIQDVERRSNVFVSGLGYRALWAPDERDMISLDDPRHRQQRALVHDRFTRSAAAEREPEVAGLVTELVDALASAGQVDVIDAIAAQLPSRVTCRLLGLDEERWRDLKRWSEQLMRVDSRDISGKAFRDFFDGNMEFMAYVGQLLPSKSACPMDDLLSVWATAEIDGQPLDPFTILHETGLFIAGGAETTRTAISHGLRAFVDHPDQWEAMAEDPSLVPGAVEEVLRWVTPLNNFFRRAVADTEIAGQPVERGDRVILLYPSANRDEAVFADPFRFDITRDPNPHVAFGFGTHLCLGMNIARMTLATVFGQLSARLTNLRVVSEPDVEPNIFARAVRSFVLAFDER
jgi:cholest-4-en-3-one 26-monooxygenase